MIEREQEEHTHTHTHTHTSTSKRIKALLKKLFYRIHRARAKLVYVYLEMRNNNSDNLLY